jgi:soluble lytic murein transglycosylase-like protein
VPRSVSRWPAPGSRERAGAAGARRGSLVTAQFVSPGSASAFAQEAARDNIDALIAEQARANKVPEAFVHRVVKRESNYMLSRAASWAKADAGAAARRAARTRRMGDPVVFGAALRLHKVPEAFVHRVVKRESNYNARAKGGSALGLMQIKHATARGLGCSRSPLAAR